MDACAKTAIVVQPGQAASSWWMPFPSNGYVDLTLVPEVTGFQGLSMGYESIPAGSHVPEHAHVTEVELQICFRGEGKLIVEGAEHRLVAGTACFLGPETKHAIVNDSVDELVMLWIAIPGGIEDFFHKIGRPRFEGESAPRPFAGPYGHHDIA